LGFDAFALNIGDPSQSYVRETLGYMFPYAESIGFKLFFSIDLVAAANVGQTLDDFTSLVTDYKNNAAYYKGPNGYGFLSTFADGGLTNAQFKAWKAKFSNHLYFVPNLDRTEGYYASTSQWWDYWGSVIDGVFSWETAWPGAGSSGEGDVSQDSVILKGTKAHSKSYMIREYQCYTCITGLLLTIALAMSTLQYKDSVRTTYNPLKTREFLRLT
jgi:glucan endo-1,3-alpha-glucosidase